MADTNRATKHREQEPEGTEKVDAARRRALTRMGRFAAYTAPAMTTYLVADRAMARSVAQRRKHGRGHWLGQFLRIIFGGHRRF